MRFVTVAAVLLASTSLAVAADPIAPTPEIVPVDTSFVNSVYVQLLGGVALQDGASWYDQDGNVTDADVDMDYGYALAATLGVVVMDGLSLEADVMHTSREYPGGGFFWDTTSLMANAKYTMPVNDMFSLYGAAGVGYVYVVSGNSGDPNAPDYAGLGYQLIGGVQANVTDNMSAVLEYRYQGTFQPAEDLGLDPNNHNIRVPTGVIMAGLKFGF